MRSEGFSLVETVVIVAIVSILAAVGTLRFRDYLHRYRAEAQTRLLFTELLKARTQAIYQRRGKRVKLHPNRFEVYSSLQDGPTVKPVAMHLLSFPITWNISGFGEPDAIDFDETGIAANYGSICLESAAAYDGVDSVVFHSVRTSIGKKDKGDECGSNSITLM